MLPKDKRASEEDLASLFEDRDFLWNAKHHNGLLKEAKASKASKAFKSTNFKETWHCVGFLLEHDQYEKLFEMGNSIDKRTLHKIGLDALSRSDGELDKKYINDILNIDISELKTIVQMVKTSYDVIEEDYGKYAGGYHVGIVHKSIGGGSESRKEDNPDTYYGLMRSKFLDDEWKDIKENTADCVVIFGYTWDQLKSALNSVKSPKSILKSNRTGVCKVGEISFIQVSLKQGEDEARLGRITKIFGKMTGVENATGLDYLKEVEEFTEEILVEGWASKILGYVSKGVNWVIDKFKDAAKFINGYINKIFSSFADGGKSKNQAAMNMILKYTEASNKDFYKQLLTEDVNFKHPNALLKYIDDNPDRGKPLVNSIVEVANATRKEVLDVISGSPNTLKLAYGVGPKNIIKPLRSIVESDNIYNRIKKDPYKPEKYNIKHKDFYDTCKRLYVNILAFLSIAEFFNKTSEDSGKQFDIMKGIKMLDDMKKQMIMGATFLPIVKIMGTGETRKEVFSYDEPSKEARIAFKEKPYIVVSVRGDGEDAGYYVVELCPFYGINNDSTFNYVQIQFTNSDTQVSFKVEGKSIFPEDSVVPQYED